MKKLFLIGLILSAMTVKGQIYAGGKEIKDAYYVEVTYMHLSGQARIDYGQGKNNGEKITDNNGKTKKFNSRAAMLNMMHNEGYEMVQMVTLKMSGSDIDGYIYTFKKITQ